MKIELKVEAPAPKALTYPILMQGLDGCIKLFLRNQDGLVLHVGPESGREGQVPFWQSRTNDTPVPATDPYWRPFVGTVTLRN